jgi:hypothetical protein
MMHSTTHFVTMVASMRIARHQVLLPDEQGLYYGSIDSSDSRSNMSDNSVSSNSSHMSSSVGMDESNTLAD